MNAKRRPDWPQLMDAAVDARREAPFVWGHHDCCLFAADVVHAMTGHDYAASLRGYTTRETAVAIIESYGSLADLVTALIGAPIPTAFAGRGDVVLAELDYGPTLGVCLGYECAFAAEVGLLFTTRAAATHAWKV